MFNILTLNNVTFLMEGVHIWHLLVSYSVKMTTNVSDYQSYIEIQGQGHTSLKLVSLPGTQTPLSLLDITRRTRMLRVNRRQ